MKRLTKEERDALMAHKDNLSELESTQLYVYDLERRLKTEKAVAYDMYELVREMGAMLHDVHPDLAIKAAQAVVRRMKNRVRTGAGSVTEAQGSVTSL